MTIEELLRRQPVVPFGPETKIPWNEPAFSERMLREHLAQDHDRASRRFEFIDRQVAWIHEVVLGGSAGRVLDLGCGPGLYTSRLAERGHRCVGIDFSPSSIAYAKQEASRSGLDCYYQLADLREAELGAGFDAVLLLFGEFNTFAPTDAKPLLDRVRAVLNPSGRLLLELQAEHAVREIGEAPRDWTIEEPGLFADVPHLILTERDWHPDVRATTERYTVFCDRAPPQVYSQTTLAYSAPELEAMLDAAGMPVVGRYESLGSASDDNIEMYGLLAECSP